MPSQHSFTVLPAIVVAEACKRWVGMYITNVMPSERGLSVAKAKFVAWIHTFYTSADTDLEESPTPESYHIVQGLYRVAESAVRIRSSEPVVVSGRDARILGEFLDASIHIYSAVVGKYSPYAGLSSLPEKQASELLETPGEILGINTKVGGTD